MGDDKTKEPAAQEAAAQEDVELAEDEAEDVKGGGRQVGQARRAGPHGQGVSGWRYAWTGAASLSRSRQLRSPGQSTVVASAYSTASSSDMAWPSA